MHTTLREYKCYEAVYIMLREYIHYDVMYTTFKTQKKFHVSFLNGYIRSKTMNTAWGL